MCSSREMSSFLKEMDGNWGFDPLGYGMSIVDEWLVMGSLGLQLFIVII